MIKSRLKSSLVFGAGTALLYVLFLRIMFATENMIESVFMTFLIMFVISSALHYAWLYWKNRKQ